MTFQICRIRGSHGLDALPVAKITDYPMEKRDYRPFAQNILCIDGETLILRMWAFEVSPPPNSELRAVLYPFSENENLALHIRAVSAPGSDAPAPEAFLLEDDKPPRAFPAKFKGVGGEDLQGVYWGTEAALSVSDLAQEGGKILTSPGSKLSGNFYKICPVGDRAHFGSFAPADWTSPYARESMGVFEIVGY